LKLYYYTANEAQRSRCSKIGELGWVGARGVKNIDEY